MTVPNFGAPFHGIMQRFKGKTATAVALTGELYVGVPTNTDVPQTNPAWYGVYGFYGAPVDGTNGTKAGFASTGSLLVDTQNAILYQNTGTQASPAWGALNVASPSSAQLITALGTSSQSGSAPITSDFAVVTVCSVSTRGSRLPPLSTGINSVSFSNGTAVKTLVYPQTGARIGTAATNASVAIVADKGGIFNRQSATVWQLIAGA